MRLYYNPEMIFKGVPDEKKRRYFKRILELAKTLDKEQRLTHEIIHQFKFKKMSGTDTIFKFYIDNQDGARCLCKYEEVDDQIFENETGLILLKATSHDQQGQQGRFFDDKLLSYDKFLVVEDETDQTWVGNDQDFKRFLGKNYLKTFVVQSTLSDEDLLDQMLSMDHKAIYKLSENQMESLSAEGPVFVMGSAGSGKTLVEVCKALKNAHSTLDQAYFTYTKMLKDSAETLYNRYSRLKGIQGSTAFFVIKNYFLDKLGISESNYMSFDKYLKWIKKRIYSDKYKFIHKLDYMDLWTEIRGLIKGYSGHDQYRILEFSNHHNMLDQDEVDLLIDQRIIQPISGSNSRYYILDSQELYQYAMGSNQAFHEVLIKQDIDSPLLDKYSYVERMKSKYTRFDRDERAIIFDFVETEYQKHLTTNHLYDDNDMARMLLRQIYDHKLLDRFDYLFIDEIQDLTELQVFTLSKLVKDPSQIFMSGDVSQVINPTFFHDGRMGVIFKHHFNQALNDAVTLKENYRNSENIVNVVGELLTLRRQTIGRYSYDIEEEATDLEKREGLPVFVNVEKEEILEIIQQWMGVPGVAVIVSNEESKRQLKKELGILKETNLYTVQEVKGQEFDKIISYNLVSDYEIPWTKIMNKELAKGSEEALQYRFYFNALYVAITRGRVNLYLYEENKELEIVKRIKYLFEEIKENALDVMNIQGYDTEENRKKQALDYFKQGDYKRAHSFYAKVNDKRMMHISGAFARLHSDDLKVIELGLFNLYHENDYGTEAYRFTNNDRFLLFKLLYGYRTKNLTIAEMAQLLGKHNIMDLVTRYKDPTKYQDFIYRKVFSDSLRIMAAINKHKVKEQIDEILGGK